MSIALFWNSVRENPTLSDDCKGFFNYFSFSRGGDWKVKPLAVPPPVL